MGKYSALRVLSTACAVSMISFLWYATLLYPFGRDQGEYACIGWLFLEGKRIYSDVVNVKPPGTHLIHALSQLIFGHSMLAIRLFDLLYQLTTASCVWLIIKRSTKSAIMARVALVGFSLTYTCFDYWNTAQTDGFQSLPILFSVLMLSTLSPSSFFVAGILIGIAVLFKYPILIFVSGSLLYLRLVYKDKLTPQLVLLNIFGILLVLSLFLILLAVTDSLGAFIDTSWNYFSSYYASGLREFDIPNYFPRGLLKGFLGVSLVVFILGLKLARSDKLMGLCSIFGLSAVFQIVVQGKFYDYHFLPLIAPWAIVFTFLVWRSSVERYLLARVSVACAATVIIGVIILAQMRHIRYWTLVRDIVTQDRTLSDVYEDPAFGALNTGKDFSSRADIEVARYLDAYSAPGSTVLVWGFEPGIYYLSKRHPATRFIYNYLQFSQYSAGPFRKQMIEDLSVSKPEYIVTVKNDAISWVTGSRNDSHKELDSFPELNAIIATNYIREIEIEDFELFRRRY